MVRHWGGERPFLGVEMDGAGPHFLLEICLKRESAEIFVATFISYVCKLNSQWMEPRFQNIKFLLYWQTNKHCKELLKGQGHEI